MEKGSKRKKAKSKEGRQPAKPDAPLVKYPDFAARAREIFGDRIFEDFATYRHREWELAMEAGLKREAKKRRARTQPVR